MLQRGEMPAFEQLTEADRARVAEIRTLLREGRELRVPSSIAYGWNGDITLTGRSVPAPVEIDRIVELAASLEDPAAQADFLDRGLVLMSTKGWDVINPVLPGAFPEARAMVRSNLEMMPESGLAFAMDAQFTVGELLRVQPRSDRDPAAIEAYEKTILERIAKDPTDPHLRKAAMMLYRNKGRSFDQYHEHMAVYLMNYQKLDPILHKGCRLRMYTDLYRCYHTLMNRRGVSAEVKERIKQLGLIEHMQQTQPRLLEGLNLLSKDGTDLGIRSFNFD